MDGKTSLGAGTSTGKKRRGSNASLEDDDEAGGGHTMAVDIIASTKEEKARELEHRALLVRGLDTEQFRRYEAWRACRWPDAVIRRVCCPSFLLSSNSLLSICYLGLAA